ncbi:asparaginase [Psychromarinibacter halotolerans]|uniref:Asparaginase n=1 Tax=Psychromarinibacter halotolerans TaxID=1775175 RepID=A0ABV7GRL6_9RHOB|nr:asparaginase [Psychromarinibacter halotolerans]MDF0595841.1 asparaginase [Psychromarinibacter halotolerans]
MKHAEALVEVWRGDLLESVHAGHAVVCDSTGAIVEAWGDPDKIIYPRSSAKMIQGLPLMDSGAADAAGLGTEHLALACASHEGAPEHTERVERWLSDMGMTDADLRCGPEFPRDEETGHAMIRAHGQPCQWHNNCSGKHSGFLTLTRHLRAGPEYVEIDHPVQQAALEAFEDVTGMTSPCYGIDGCAAPNFATSVHGLARAMARFAAAGQGGGVRDASMARLRDAMIAHPSLVAGEGRACTELMQALGGRGALKTGAEGVFVGILPQQGLGLALKIADGATRASECALAAILVRLGVLDPTHPAAIKRINPPIPNRRGMTTGEIRPAAALA